MGATPTTLVVAVSFSIVFSTLFSTRAAGQQQHSSSDEVARLVQEYLDARTVEEPKPLEALMSHVNLFGDLRLRQEEDYRRGVNRNRSRSRARVRLGLSYELQDDLLVELRFATGERNDPKSTHVTFGDGLERVDFNLDRLSLRWQPRSVKGLEFTAGKFAHGLRGNPVYQELTWDADLQPEGLVTQYVWKNEGTLSRFSLLAGRYLLLEARNSRDVALNVFGASAVILPGAGWQLDLSTAAYFFEDPTPSGSPALFNDDAGNELVDRDGDGNADDFLSDFRILHATMAARTDVGKRPLVLGAEVFHNQGARTSRDQGYSLGVAWGSLRERGDWRLYYQWQVVGRDAVFSPTSQDDFLRSTGFRGHVAGIRYQARKKLGFHLWGLISAAEARQRSPLGRESSEWRFRLDLDLRF